MSLNYSAAVTQAYEAALAESAGWFMLKYASRDKVDVLRAGSDGLEEARSAIAEYEEKSPLYGMVLFRRKKILIKYVPDGTSRLLQARLAVHLQSIIERFPHDALIDLTRSSDLDEKTLPTSISALKASASVKSFDSTKSRRRLTGIAEDAGESPAIVGESVGTAIPRGSDEADGPDAPLQGPSSKEPEITHDEKQTTTGSHAVPIVRLNSERLELNQPETSEPLRKPFASLESPTDMLDAKAPKAPTVSHRLSISSEQTAQVFKTKIKLGPRPSVDHGSLNAAGAFSRPVSTLPAGIRMPSRPVPRVERPQTQQTHTKSFFSGAQLYPLKSTAISVSGLNQPGRPLSRAGSAVTVPAYAHYDDKEPSYTSSSITPEKQRLMKALQKRKKKKTPKVPTDESLPIEQINNSTTTPMGKPRDLANIYEHIRSDPVENDAAINEGQRKDVEEELEEGQRGVQGLELDPKPTDTQPTVVGTLSKGTAANLRDYEEANDDTGAHILEDPHQDLKTESFSGTGLEDKKLPLAEHVVSKSSPLGKEILADYQINLSLKLETHSDEASAGAQTPTGPQDHRASTPHVQTPVVDTAGSNGPQKADTQEIVVNADHFRDAVQHKVERDLPLHPAGTAKAGVTRNASKRLGIVAPLKVGDHSEATSLSGESLLEELQSATFEEAKPILVSKSPAIPYYPGSPRSVTSRKSSDGAKGLLHTSNLNDGAAPPASFVRSGTNPEATLLRTTSSSRSIALTSVSSSLHDPIRPREEATTPKQVTLGTLRRQSSCDTASTEQGASTPKKSFVSSLISQRIKALEKFSNASQQGGATAIRTSTTVNQRKASFSTSPSLTKSSSTEGYFRRTGSSPGLFPPQRRDISPERLQNVAGAAGSSLFQPGSVSVKAQIVRDRADMMPDTQLKSTAPTSLNLHLSPLVVEHKQPSKTSKRSRRPKSSSNSSISSTRDSVVLSKRDSFSSRRSTSSRKDSADTVRASYGQNLEPFRGPEGDKKESQKRSLLQRMSSSFSRRSGIQQTSPPLNDQPIVEHQEPDPAKAWSTSVVVGEVNVQFPDNLLWKRRHLKVDNSGFLILSPSKLDEGSRIGIKKFHISDFKIPYVPEPDREELPYSVVLDFKDSSTLQCACESASGQASVLAVLQKAHAALSAG